MLSIYELFSDNLKSKFKKVGYGLAGLGGIETYGALKQKNALQSQERNQKDFNSSINKDKDQIFSQQTNINKQSYERGASIRPTSWIKKLVGSDTQEKANSLFNNSN